MAEGKNHRALYLLIACAGLCVVLDVLIYLRPELFNHNSEYQWRVLWHGKKGAVIWVWLLWSAMVVSAFMLWKAFTKRVSGKKLDGLGAGMIFLLGVLSPLVFFQADRFGSRELLVRVFVEDHTGYFTDAVKYKTREGLLAAYAKDDQSFFSLSTHSRTHPPADTLVFMGLIRAAEKLQALQGIYKLVMDEDERGQVEDSFQLSLGEQTGGMLAALMMLLGAALAGVLGYFLLRKFYSADLCFISGLALVSMPAFAAKAPVMDQVFAVFILGSCLLAISGGKRKWGLGLISGFLVGAGAWLSPGAWSAGLLIPLVIAAKEIQSRPGKGLTEILKAILIVGLPAVIGAGLAIGIGSVLVDASYWEIFSINREGWHFNNSASGRISPSKWIFFNPYEYFFWSSLPIFMGFLAKIYNETGNIVKKSLDYGQIDAFFWLSLIFIIILNVSGQICYESPRLCWFFLPILANFGISGLSLDMQNLHNKTLLSMIILMSAQTGIMLLIY